MHPRLHKPEGRDLVALQVQVTGQKDGKPARVTFRLIDYYDAKHGISAMMRTTGYSLSITGQMQVDGRVKARACTPRTRRCRSRPTSPSWPSAGSRSRNCPRLAGQRGLRGRGSDRGTSASDDPSLLRSRHRRWNAGLQGIVGPGADLRRVRRLVQGRALRAVGGDLQSGAGAGWALAAVPPGASRKLLVIAEDWCGDASNTVPIMAKLADAAPGLELRVILRDQNPEVMDQYLTNGTRSIPIVIVLDEDFQELGHWGPRPTELQAWVMANRGTIRRPSCTPRSAPGTPATGARRRSGRCWRRRDSGGEVA